MKNLILHMLVRAALVSLVAGLLVAILGIVLHWKTPVQFSDGFFWAGAILMLIGFMNVMGMLHQSSSGLEYRQSSVQRSKDERFQLLEADTYRGYTLLGIMGISGLLMFGLSGLAIAAGNMF
ncbi:MAG TPA: hypothetical protein VMT91_09315 [Anaerolineales bacterium]|nr:hypothetical protein [Anaerolineales bacterium]